MGWQDGFALPLDEVWNNMIEGNPPMKDNATGKWINNAKSWLTDQSYTGGHGEDPNGVPYHNDGPHNNYDLCTKSPDWTEPWPIPQNAWTCAHKKHPWAFPGYATELGEGCGIHGGNPFGCPLRQQSHRHRLPPSEDDSVDSRQRRARGLCGDLPRWRIQLQALQGAVHRQEGSHRGVF